MRNIYIILFFILLTSGVYANEKNDIISQDTNEVINLLKQAYGNRLTNPEQTVNDAGKALSIAQKINYITGIGESYRVIGIGKYYLNEPENAIDNYLNALPYFAKANNLKGEAKVYNNIGNLYLDNDYDRSLEYFNKSLVLAKEMANKTLTGSLYLNIGNVYYRKKNFYQALNYYDKSNQIFNELKDSVNLMQCLQNKGVIYFNLNQFDKAQQLLLEANKEAKEKDLNESVASIDLTLASLYIAQNKFADAEKTVQEGLAYADLLKDTKLQYDFKHTTYELEYKRKNYARALSYLADIYKQDSVMYKTNVSTKINLLDKKRKQEEIQRENELTIYRQRNDKILFLASSVVAFLLLIVIVLLVGNVKRKVNTNNKLTELNGEISRQKDNLDRVNHHLEEIIDERTKDLQVKNKKLSEYSSYLSHQIRGPIATLKGLMNLEKEGLVDQQECINMMDKCVSEIDEKIIEMSDMLHDPSRAGFSKS